MHKSIFTCFFLFLIIHSAHSQYSKVLNRSYLTSELKELLEQNDHAKLKIYLEKIFQKKRINANHKFNHLVFLLNQDYIKYYQFSVDMFLSFSEFHEPFTEKFIENLDIKGKYSFAKSVSENNIEPLFHNAAFILKDYKNHTSRAFILKYLHQIANLNYRKKDCLALSTPWIQSNDEVYFQGLEKIIHMKNIPFIILHYKDREKVRSKAINIILSKELENIYDLIHQNKIPLPHPKHGAEYKKYFTKIFKGEFNFEKMFKPLQSISRLIAKNYISLDKNDLIIKKTLEALKKNDVKYEYIQNIENLIAYNNNTELYEDFLKSILSIPRKQVHLHYLYTRVNDQTNASLLKKLINYAYENENARMLPNLKKVKFEKVKSYLNFNLSSHSKKFQHDIFNFMRAYYFDNNISAEVIYKFLDYDNLIPQVIFATRKDENFASTIIKKINHWILKREKRKINKTIESLVGYQYENIIHEIIEHKEKLSGDNLKVIFKLANNHGQAYNTRLINKLMKTVGPNTTSQEIWYFQNQISNDYNNWYQFKNRWKEYQWVLSHSDENTDENWKSVYNKVISKNIDKLSLKNDSDRDGLKDEWEKKYFNNLSQTYHSDNDLDGFTNFYEQAHNSNPINVNDEEKKEFYQAYYFNEIMTNLKEFNHTKNIQTCKEYIKLKDKYGIQSYKDHVEMIIYYTQSLLAENKHKEMKKRVIQNREIIRERLSDFEKNKYLAITDVAMGKIAQKESKYELAIEFFENAKNYLIKMNDLNNVPAMYCNIHNAYIDKGNLRKAERMILLANQKVKEYQIKDNAILSRVLINSANFYYLIGRYKKALGYANDSIKLLSPFLTKDPQLYSTAYVTAAKCAQELGDYHFAYVRLLSANNYLKDRKLGLTDMAINVHANIANLHHNAGEWEKANSIYNSLIKFKNTSQNKNGLYSFYNNRGYNFLCNNKLKEAEVDFLKVIDSKKDPKLILQTFSNMGIIRMLQGKHDEAIKYFNKANKFHDEKLMDSTQLANEESKMSFISKLRNKLDLAISYDLKYSNGHQNIKQHAFNLLLNRKGITQYLLKREDIFKSKHYKEYIELKTKFSNFHFKERQAYGLSYTLNSAVQMESELDILKSKMDEEFLNKTPITPINIDIISKHLPENSLFIDFVEYKEYDLSIPKKNKLNSNTQFAIYTIDSNKNIRSYKLDDQKKFSTEISYFKKSILNKNDSLTKEYGELLFSKLFNPIKKEFKHYDKIFISPEGMFSMLPFSCLIFKGEYLIKNKDILLLNSARDFITNGQKNESSNTVFVSDPNYNLNFKRKSYIDQLSIFFNNKVFTRLPGIKLEGELLNKEIKGSLLITGDNATEKLIKQVQSPKIFHIASHAYYLEHSLFRDRFIENPMLRSGIALAGANHLQGDGNDGILTAYELSSMNLSGTKLVVLSACETAAGETRRGEGVLGMRRALAAAGAKSQLLTLWPVDDIATKDFMIKFYANLQKQKNVYKALKKTKIEIMKSNKSSPYYWSPYILTGDYKTEVSL